MSIRQPTGPGTEEPPSDAALPETRQQAGQETGQDSGPETGPETAHPADQETGRQSDPEPGRPADQDTGQPADQDTGQPADQDTGQPADPETAVPVRPEAGQETAPQVRPPAAPQVRQPATPQVGQETTPRADQESGQLTDQPSSRWRLPLLALGGVVVVIIAVVLFGALRDRPASQPSGGNAAPVGTPGGTPASAGAPATGTGGAPSGAGTTPAPAGGGASAAPPRPAPGDHVAASPVGGLTTASLDVVDGSSALTLQVAALGKDLYRVQTPADGALRPVVDTRGAGQLAVRLKPTGKRGPGSVTIVLNPAVAWSIKLSGSAERQTLNLTGARLTALDLAGGSGAIDVTLPPPNGTMVLTVSGGAGQLRVHTPRDVPARVRIGTGAGQVTVDGAARQGVPPGTTLAPPTWDRAQNRYDLNVTAGVAGLTLDRT